jgi:hypothetical protein
MQFGLSAKDNANSWYGQIADENYIALRTKTENIANVFRMSTN